MEEHLHTHMLNYDSQSLKVCCLPKGADVTPQQHGALEGAQWALPTVGQRTRRLGRAVGEQDPGVPHCAAGRGGGSPRQCLQEPRPFQSASSITALWGSSLGWTPLSSVLRIILPGPMGCPPLRIRGVNSRCRAVHISDSTRLYQESEVPLRVGFERFLVTALSPHLPSCHTVEPGRAHLGHHCTPLTGSTTMQCTCKMRVGAGTGPQRCALLFTQQRCQGRSVVNLCL